MGTIQIGKYSAKVAGGVIVVVAMAALLRKGRGKPMSWWLRVPQMSLNVIRDLNRTKTDRFKALCLRLSDNHYWYESPFLRTLWRTGGRWAQQDVEVLANLVESVPGDFAEIGVFRGDVISQMIPLMRKQGKRCHAFDSFVGMGPELPDDNAHPEGAFNVGGPEGFISIMAERGISRDEFDIHPGWIPDCFEGTEFLQLSLVVLDVDRYYPTRDALAWLWPRLSVGGIVAFDDFALNFNKDCTKAINEFLRESSDFQLVNYSNCQLIIRKIS